MGRKKKPQTLPELYAAKEEAEDELKKAKQSAILGYNLNLFCFILSPVLFI